MRLPPVGFWSYARQDDELSSGKLTTLRSFLMHELQQQYGRDAIQLFQDLTTIPHGSAWEKEIKKALDQSTFFIAIVTPNFIQSEWCSREVELFLEREARLASLYADLPDRSRIFPILFIDVEDVEPENPAVLAALQQLQWFDFRKFRHKSYDDASVREAISDLASSMRDLLKVKVSPLAGDDEAAEPVTASEAGPGGRTPDEPSVPAPGPAEPPIRVAARETSRAAAAPQRRGGDVEQLTRPPAETSAAPSPPPAATAPEAVPAEPAAPAPPQAVKVGDLLNHIFEVKRFIKSGGMGQVFEGVNVITGERVAIKALLPALAADPKVINLFQREAITLTKLHHEALVQYRVVAKEPQLGTLYIVTEFIDGIDLGEALDQVNRSSKELRRLLGRLAGGLDAAHQLGAIHRDMSPDNVMLPGGDLHRAKIIDFGIAKDLGGSLPTIIGDGFAGKMGFVAPEQLGDYGAEIGSWTDVYSLALVILSVAKGDKVDMAGSFADAVRKRREGPDLSDAPEDLRDLLADMLRPDPADRLRTMDDVLERLAEDVAERPPPRRPTPEPVEPPAAEEAVTVVASEPEAWPEPEPEPYAAESTADAQSWSDAPDERPRWKVWLALGGGLVLALLLALMLRPSPDQPAPPVPVPPVIDPDPVMPVIPPAPPDRSWLHGRWCVRGDRDEVMTIREEGDELVLLYLGERQVNPIRPGTDEGSVRTNVATYTRNSDGRSVTVTDGGVSYPLRRCP